MEVHHPVFYVSLGHMQNNMRSSVTLKLKLALTLTLTDPLKLTLTLTLTLIDTDRRRCPDPNARIQKFIRYMATTPQLQNSM